MSRRADKECDVTALNGPQIEELVSRIETLEQRLEKVERVDTEQAAVDRSQAEVSRVDGSRVSGSRADVRSEAKSNASLSLVEPVPPSNEALTHEILTKV